MGFCVHPSCILTATLVHADFSFAMTPCEAWAERDTLTTKESKKQTAEREIRDTPFVDGVLWAAARRPLKNRVSPSPPYLPLIITLELNLTQRHHVPSCETQRAMAPFNFIVTWTWPILGIAVALYSLGSAAHSKAGQNVLVSSAYTLSSSTFASNFCAGALYASGEPESFAVCDVVGVGVGAIVQGARIHYTFTQSEWEYVQDIPRNARNGIAQAFEGSVNRAREIAMLVVRSVRHTGRKVAGLGRWT